MTKLSNVWVLPALVAMLVTIGCSQETTRKDVASAQDKMQKEHQRTQETIQDQKNKVADAQQNAQEHTAAKPVTPDTTAANDQTKDQQKVADAQASANEKIAKQKEKEREAEGNLKDKQQNLQMTQERDAYVKGIEQKLADTDNKIDQLKQKASNAQGADKDNINRQVDTLKTQRDMAKKALDDLKGADLANWKNHQEHVRVALQDLDNSMRNIK